MIEEAKQETEMMDQISKIMRVAVDRKNEQQEYQESQSSLVQVKLAKKEIR